VTTVGAPPSHFVICRIAQGVAAVPDEATAFSHRDAGYLLHPITMWTEPGDDEGMIAVNRAPSAAMRPFTRRASYLNCTRRPTASATPTARRYARLVALKDTYDPTNLFRLNQNIRPGQPAPEGCARVASRPVGTVRSRSSRGDGLHRHPACGSRPALVRPAGEANAAARLDPYRDRTRVASSAA
jgi:Berberine and berberine like